MGTRWTLPNGGRLVGLPHLSRFGIITWAASQAALEEFFGEHDDRTKTLASSSVMLTWLQRNLNTDLSLVVPQPEG